ERVRAVFELIARPVRAVRELARLADDRDSRPEGERGGGADDEAARLDAEHRVDPPSIWCDEGFDHGAEGIRVGEQRRDVLEDDPGFREIRDVADETLEIGHLLDAPREAARRAGR